MRMGFLTERDPQTKRTVRVLGKLCGADPKELEKLILSEGFAIDSNLDVPSKSISRQDLYATRRS